jgi:diguanylate cyclase (GGDEF)-like protein
MPSSTPTAVATVHARGSGAWSAADLTLLDAGLVGERLVARIRLWLCALLFVVPLHSTLTAPVTEHLIGLAIAGGALAIAIVIHAAVRRGVFAPWIGWLTAAMDVTIVTSVLVVYLLIGRPHTATNSKVVFECYFVAIAGTCLRYDRRIPWIAGGMAMAQYAAVVSYADWRWELNAASFAPYEYGVFDWSAQVSRLILLLGATALSATIVARGMRLRQLSTVDRLTGLLNRGYFDERADEELSRAARYRHPLSLALVDVDHFKAFNDTYGHAAGDVALRALAGVMRGTVRRSDIVARYGGEEFVLLFPETSAAEAAEKLDAIRMRVKEMAIALPRHSAPVRLTISAGVASWPADGETIEDVMFRADGRLFAAKRAGRNRVVRSDEALPDTPPMLSLEERREQRHSPSRGTRRAAE